MAKLSIQLKLLGIRQYLMEGKRIPVGLSKTTNISNLCDVFSGQAQEQVDLDRAEYERQPLAVDPW